MMLEKIKGLFASSAIPTVTATPPEKMMGEQAWYHDSDMFRLLGGIDRFNPDELVQRKGNQIYRKMLRDPQVKAAYSLRTNIIISRGWRFKVDQEDHQEMADFFEAMITDHFVGTWIQAMRSILLCKAHGFSVTEKVFETAEVDGKVRWLVKALKPKPYHTFEFDTDNFGNINKIIQTIEGADKIIPREKVVLMVNHPEYDPIWGESDLRAVYRPYWEKDVTLKFKNIYIERLAGGFIVATANKDAPNLSPVERVAFESALSRIQQMTAMRVPQGHDVQVVHGPATSAFEDSVSFNDQQILRGLLIPNLMGFADIKNGSRALGDTQLDSFMMTVQEEGEYLADILNEQVFAQMAWWNFGRKDFPRFMLDGYTTTQKRKIAETWNIAVKDGVVVNTLKDENRTRDLLLYPAIKEDEWDEQREESPDPGESTVLKPGDAKILNPDKVPGVPINPNIKPEDRLGPKNPNVKPDMMDRLKILWDSGGEDKEFASLMIEGMVKGDLFENKRPEELSPAESSVDNSSDPDGTPLVGYKQTFIDRVNFADIKNKFETNEKQFSKEMAVPVNQMLEEMIEQLKKAKSKSTELSISSKTKSDFKKVVKNNLRKNYELGRKEAEKVLLKSLKDDVVLKDRLTMKMQFASAWNVCCTVPQWTVRHFVDGLLLESAEKFFESFAFQTTSDITEAMLDATREVLVTGIDEEQSIDEMVSNLRKAIPTLIGTPSADGTISDKANKARLDTIARTSITNIFSQAQLALYNDPSLGDFVQGMEYSAVLDSRTTATCESLNGKKFMKDDPIWGTITPPNHFNCRSLLIPITAMDKGVEYSGKKE